jgi:hypothetical protein
MHQDPIRVTDKSNRLDSRSSGPNPRGTESRLRASGSSETLEVRGAVTLRSLVNWSLLAAVKYLNCAPCFGTSARKTPRSARSLRRSKHLN